MGEDKYERFANLSYSDFRRLAQDNSLSRYEKIGFPDSYRKGKEEYIFMDIKNKIPILSATQKVVLEIGPGCSDLAFYLIKYCIDHHHELFLIDSKEMLSHLPDHERVFKYVGYYPNCPDLLDRLKGTVDIIICYSVFHYIFKESNTWDFIDKTLLLLSPGGHLLIGDIPNISKRKRFFASETGVQFHKKFMQTNEPPEVYFNKIEEGAIDDAVIMALIMRARIAGFDAYILPQPPQLPMANRREDILIIRP